MNRSQKFDSTVTPGNSVPRPGYRVPTADPVKRLAYLWCGHSLMGLGFVGIPLPLMPTTVFWILAAMCYAKSSPERYQRLLGRRRTGQVIQGYLEHGVIPSKGKWVATLSMLITATLIWSAPLGDVATMIGLFAVASAAVYVVTRPSVCPTVRQF